MQNKDLVSEYKHTYSSPKRMSGSIDLGYKDILQIFT